MLETGANDVLVVRAADTELSAEDTEIREILIPYRPDEVVKTVDALVRAAEWAGRRALQKVWHRASAAGPGLGRTA